MVHLTLPYFENLKSLNPFFIRSVCGSYITLTLWSIAAVLIPSSSGQSVVQVSSVYWRTNFCLNPFFIRSVCGSPDWDLTIEGPCLNPFFIRSVCGSYWRMTFFVPRMGLNPFFIRSVCGSLKSTSDKLIKLVLIPSSSGQSVVPRTRRKSAIAPS